MFKVIFIPNYSFKVLSKSFLSQVEALHQHLIDAGCSPDEMQVWIAEDATAIVNRVEYQPSNGQVCGFTLPTNEETGMPIPFSFPATSPKDVYYYFKHEKKPVS